MSVRIGLIGAGQIGEDHARRIAEKVPGAQITAVASRRQTDYFRTTIKNGKLFTNSSEISSLENKWDKMQRK